MHLDLYPLSSSPLVGCEATVQRGRKSRSTLYLSLGSPWLGSAISLFPFLPEQEAACFGKLYFSSDNRLPQGLLGPCKPPPVAKPSHPSPLEAAALRNSKGFLGVLEAR